MSVLKWVFCYICRQYENVLLSRHVQSKRRQAKWAKVALEKIPC